MRRFVILHTAEGGNALDVHTQHAEFVEDVLLATGDGPDWQYAMTDEDAIELAGKLLLTVDNAGYEASVVFDLLAKMRRAEGG